MKTIPTLTPVDPLRADVLRFRDERFVLSFNPLNGGPSLPGPKIGPDPLPPGVLRR